jgi:crossover junction endodeoxyribonuclease RuvC
VGYGILERSAGRLLYLDHGCIVTRKEEEMGGRLLSIFARIADLIEEWDPGAASMESIYFWKNVSSALPVTEAKGVIRLAFARASVSLVEYSPTAIKQAVSGSARADKDQVQEMVRLLLGLKEIPKPDHAADALAAAICLANHEGALAGLS